MVGARTIGVVFLCTAVGGCTELPSYKYRIVVEAETPNGNGIGASVIEIAARGQPKILPDMPPRTVFVRGEAVVVDLPNGQKVFALLQGRQTSGNAPLVMQSLLSRKERAESYGNQVDHIKSLRTPTPLDLVNYPLLVCFRDILDPSTVEIINPLGDDACGYDEVRIRSISVSATNQPVTKRINTVLPWLTNLKGDPKAPSEWWRINVHPAGFEQQ